MSTIKVNAIQNTSGVEVYTAKAWVNFNGTGTVAIRAAGNVSSITDNGAGDYTVNFTAALSDALYCVLNSFGAASSTVTSPQRTMFVLSKSTTSFRTLTTNSTAGFDPEFDDYAVFR